MTLNNKLGNQIISINIEVILRWYNSKQVSIQIHYKTKTKAFKCHKIKIKMLKFHSSPNKCPLISNQLINIQSKIQITFLSFMDQDLVKTNFKLKIILLKFKELEIILVRTLLEKHNSLLIWIKITNIEIFKIKNLFKIKVDNWTINNLEATMMNVCIKPDFRMTNMSIKQTMFWWQLMDTRKQLHS